MRNLNQILQGMQDWQNSLNNAPSLIQLFDQGNSFMLNVKSFEASASNYIHIYPGIEDGDLVFYSILSKYDTPQMYQSGEIENYITTEKLVATSIPGNNSESLPTNVATARIEDWDQNYNTWISDQVTTADGMFQAFSMPSEDLDESYMNQVSFMALCENSSSPNGHKSAELIVWNNNLLAESNQQFDDVVRPVPPFGLYPGTDQQSFYLLTLALTPVSL